MIAKTVRDVQRPGFIQFLAIYMYKNHILQCPVNAHNPSHAAQFNNFQKWWFLEASKLIIQWYEAPSLPPPPPMRKKDMTKQEKDAYFKMYSIVQLIKQFIDLGWIIQDRTQIMIVTDLGRQQLDKIATFFKQYKKNHEKKEQEEGEKKE